jgi:hypothetical protein
MQDNLNNRIEAYLCDFDQLKRDLNAFGADLETFGSDLHTFGADLEAFRAEFEAVGIVLPELRTPRPCA